MHSSSFLNYLWLIFEDISNIIYIHICINRVFELLSLSIRWFWSSFLSFQHRVGYGARLHHHMYARRFAIIPIEPIDCWHISAQPCYSYGLPTVLLFCFLFFPVEKSLLFENRMYHLLLQKMTWNCGTTSRLWGLHICNRNKPCRDRRLMHLVVLLPSFATKGTIPHSKRDNSRSGTRIFYWTQKKKKRGLLTWECCIILVSFISAIQCNEDPLQRMTIISW